MEYKADVIKNQKFEWGRTINPSKCDCEKCDFMHCPKHNYCVKTKPHKYSVKDFWDNYKDDILKRGKDFKFTYFYWNELVGECFRFPKGTYFRMGLVQERAANFDENIYQGIELVTFTRRGTELTRGHIDQYGKVLDYSMTDAQYNLAYRIAKGIKQIREYIAEEFDRIRAECKTVIGWLDREGNHYPCETYHHSEKAEELGYTETELECNGWVKIFGSKDCYCCQHKTEEQIKWLYDNGVLKDWEIQHYEDRGLL